ncbi:radical SAM protein [Bacteroidota bacterium]
MSKEIYINSTLAFCRQCNEVEQARIISRDNRVYLERSCPVNGLHSTRISSDYNWYTERMKYYSNFPKPKKHKDSIEGCPKDCGLCQWHSNAIILPVFSITNACNLDCPKCFTYNRRDAKYYKSSGETKQIIHQIIEQSGGVQLINLTGGEPTLHPNLFEIIDACKVEGIRRITMNTNGIKLASNREFAEKLKESGVQLVLSLDTLNPEVSKIIYGKDLTVQKLKALEIIEELEIPITILSVSIKDLNEKDISSIAKTYLKKEIVRSMTIQNMTFTGLNGSKFEPREHITIDDVEAYLTEETEFCQNDFFPLASYHPMCYSIAYYFSKDSVFIPLTKILGRNSLIKLTTDSYLIDPGRDFSREFLNGINLLWADGEDERSINILKGMINQLYPADREVTQKERQDYFEKYFKMIYIHSHMDEDNFDLDRVSRCGDIVPDESGNMIPACSYNLLYRQKDTRFWVES